jgi:putative transposase
MPRRPRRSLSALYVHVTNRSIRKTPFLLRPSDYRGFLAVLREGLERHPLPLLSYCVMPNHWHLVMGPVDPPTLTRLMHWVTTTHAVRWHAHHQSTGQGPVYQGRFHAQPIDSAAGLVRVCRYVERNALRAALVQRAQDWPWGSLAERLREPTCLPLTSTPFLASGAWIEYVNAAAMVTEHLVGPTPGTKKVKSVENRPVPLDDGPETPGGFAGAA